MGRTFGGFADSLWRRSTADWFGSRSSFLFRCTDRGETVSLEVFQGNGGDSHYLWSDHSGMGFGGTT
jgi:hypothetical protein